MPSHKVNDQHYSLFQSYPQHPDKTIQHAYEERMRVGGLTISLVLWVEAYAAMTPLEIIECAELPPIKDKAWGKTQAGKRYRARRETARHFLGYDVPVSAPKALETSLECSMCYQQKPIFEFSGDKRNAGRAQRHSHCRDCRAKYARDRRRIA